MADWTSPYGNTPTGRDGDRARVDRWGNREEDYKEEPLDGSPSQNERDEGITPIMERLFQAQRERGESDLYTVRREEPTSVFKDIQKNINTPSGHASGSFDEGAPSHLLKVKANLEEELESIVEGSDEDQGGAGRSSRWLWTKHFSKVKLFGMPLSTALVYIWAVLASAAVLILATKSFGIEAAKSPASSSASATAMHSQMMQQVSNQDTEQTCASFLCPTGMFLVEGADKKLCLLFATSEPLPIFENGVTTVNKKTARAKNENTDVDRTAVIERKVMKVDGKGKEKEGKAKKGKTEQPTLPPSTTTTSAVEATTTTSAVEPTATPPEEDGDGDVSVSILGKTEGKSVADGQGLPEQKQGRDSGDGQGLPEQKQARDSEGGDDELFASSSPIQLSGKVALHGKPLGSPVPYRAMYGGPTESGGLLEELGLGIDEDEAVPANVFYFDEENVNNLLSEAVTTTTLMPSEAVITTTFIPSTAQEREEDKGGRRHGHAGKATAEQQMLRKQREIDLRGPDAREIYNENKGRRMMSGGDEGPQRVIKEGGKMHKIAKSVKPGKVDATVNISVDIKVSCSPSPAPREALTNNEAEQVLPSTEQAQQVCNQDYCCVHEH